VLTAYARTGRAGPHPDGNAHTPVCALPLCCQPAGGGC
jgi:hypothetical protein